MGLTVEAIVEGLREMSVRADVLEHQVKGERQHNEALKATNTKLLEDAGRRERAADKMRAEIKRQQETIDENGAGAIREIHGMILPRMTSDDPFVWMVEVKAEIRRLGERCGALVTDNRQLDKRFLESSARIAELEAKDEGLASGAAGTLNEVSAALRDATARRDASESKNSDLCDQRDAAESKLRYLQGHMVVALKESKS